MVPELLSFQCPKCQRIAQVPFQSETTVALVFKILREDPIPPHTLNPNISLELSNICLKAIAKDKEQRYKTAEQLQQDLHPFIKD